MHFARLNANVINPVRVWNTLSRIVKGPDGVRTIIPLIRSEKGGTAMFETNYKILIKGNRRVILFHPPLHSDDEKYTSIMIPYERHDKQLNRYVMGVMIQRVRRDALRTIRMRVG